MLDMSASAEEFERVIVEKLLATLQELPSVRATLKGRDVPYAPNKHRVDAEFDLAIGDRDYVLLVEAKKSVYPRDAREVLWTMKQIKEYARGAKYDEHVIPLLAAESLSPGAKELLKSENVGYFDTGGSLYIPAPGAYVYIEKAPPKIFSNSTRPLFKGTRAQVLHALFHERDTWLGVHQLARIALVSPATASQTLTSLERFDWIETRGQGPSKERRLTEPAALLNEWKKHVLAERLPAAQRYFVPGMQIESLIGKIADVCEAHKIEYVITQEAAAQIYTPYLTTISRVSCRLAPGFAVNALIQQLDAREVTEGANLFIFETRSYGEFLFKEKHDAAWLASPIQVFLDLVGAGGRSQELAEHLRRERIHF
jgi:hypothetical protein